MAQPREDFVLPQRDGAAEALDHALNPRPAMGGFALPPVEACQMTSLPPSFIDRCRRAYLSVPVGAEGRRVVGVTSAMHGEGKTSIAIGMATAMAADTGAPTVLVEADLEYPSVYWHLSYDRGIGLSDWLEGATSLRILRSAIVVNKYVLPAGAPRTEVARLFHQLNEAGLMEALRERFTNIVVDLPPVLDIAYGSLASSLADNLILVARYGRTQMGDLEKVIYLLGRERLSGLILNATEYRTPGWLRRLL